MCSPNAIIWFRNQLSAAEVVGKDILEIGAYDVNGSLRFVLGPLAPNQYIGTDIRAGPGVDTTCAAENLVRRFGPHRFDIVISTSTFEHVRHWRAALHNMKTLCRPGGLLLFTVPARWPYHGFPRDYWRYSPKDVSLLFNDCRQLAVAVDEHPFPDIPPGQAGDYVMVYAIFQKPMGSFAETDLATHHLYSVITGSRVYRHRIWHYLTRFFIGQLWSEIARPRLQRFRLIIKMGIHHRLLAPLKIFRPWE